MQKIKPDIDEIFAGILSWLPKPEGMERKISLQLYRLLAEGSPVSPERLADTTGISIETVKGNLNSWIGVYYDDNKHVIGYWGLALPETPHRFIVDGKTLFTWCAWDSIFIPAILKKTAKVESKCKASKSPVKLTVTPEGIKDVDPAGAVISFYLPESEKVEEDVISNLCSFIHFFSSEDAGRSWVSEKPGTFLVTLNEAWQISRRKNEYQYSDDL